MGYGRMGVIPRSLERNEARQGRGVRVGVGRAPSSLIR